MIPAKRMILAALLLCAAGAPRPAAAAWGGLVSLGDDVLFADPSCAADATGSAVCAAVSRNSGLMANRYAGGKWSGWQALKGTIDGKAGCARIATSHVVCGIRNGSDALVAYSFAAGAWTGPVTIGGALSSSPSCAALAVGRALCAGLDQNGNVFSATYDGTAWKLLPVQKTTAFSPINCVPDDRGQAICVWTGAQHHVIAQMFNGASWLAALDIGGRGFGPPACADSGLRGGTVTCYGTGTDLSGYYQTYGGSGWSRQDWAGQWLSFGGTLTGISCAQNGSDSGVVSNVCTATGVYPGNKIPYGQLWGFGAYPVGGADTWSPLGGQVIGTPSCITLDVTVATGRVMCVAQTLANTAISVIGP